MEQAHPAAAAGIVTLKLNNVEHATPFARSGQLAYEGRLHASMLCTQPCSSLAKCVLCTPRCVLSKAGTPDQNADTSSCPQWVCLGVPPMGLLGGARMVFGHSRSRSSTKSGQGLEHLVSIYYSVGMHVCNRWCICAWCLPQRKMKRLGRMARLAACVTHSDRTMSEFPAEQEEQCHCQLAIDHLDVVLNHNQPWKRLR